MVNVYGARMSYPLPCLVIDFGTAVTFDLVSRTGVFEGGLIFPGVQTALNALEEKAALLPKLKHLGGGRRIVARSTREAMSNGLLNGYGALADGLIEQFRAACRGQMTVVATGGLAKYIARFSKGIRRVDPWHTIRSLILLYDEQVKQK